MASPVAGDAARVTVPVKTSGLIGTLLNYPRMRVRVERIVLYCPDGTDPGIPANTDTVYVGPNKAAAFPLQPGAWTEMQNVNPFDIACVTATASQLLFIHFGGGIDDSGK